MEVNTSREPSINVVGHVEDYKAHDNVHDVWEQLKSSINLFLEFEHQRLVSLTSKFRPISSLSIGVGLEDQKHLNG